MLLLSGMVLIAIGSALFIAGFAGLTNPIPCAITGCPSVFSANYAIEWAEISVGVVFIVSGIGMVIASRRVNVVADVREPPEPNLTGT